MKNINVVKQLRLESAKYVPDVKEKVLSQFDVASSSPTQKKVRTWAVAFSSVTAAIAVCLVVVLSLMLPPKFPALIIPDTTTICIRMNPSVEFTVNDGIVSSVRALNQDAILLLTQKNYVGHRAEDACSEVAAVAQKMKYLSKNSEINLMVFGKDEEIMAQAVAARLGNDYRVKLETPTAATAKNAKNLGITVRKMHLIDQIILINPQQKAAQLALMDAEDLLEILEDYDEEALADYEQALQSEYQKEYTEFVENLLQDLKVFPARLNVLVKKCVEDSPNTIEINLLIDGLNDDLKKYSSELYLTKLKGNNAEELEELLEEIKELQEELNELSADIESDATEAFEDLYEDFLDQFKAEQKDKDRDD